MVRWERLRPPDKHFHSRQYAGARRDTAAPPDWWFERRFLCLSKAAALEAPIKSAGRGKSIGRPGQRPRKSRRFPINRRREQVPGQAPRIFARRGVREHALRYRGFVERHRSPWLQCWAETR